MNDMPKTKLKSTSRLLVLLMAFCMLATVITTVLVSTSTKADGATISVNSAGAFTNALSSSANGDTIRLTGNFSMGTTTTSISGSKTVTLDLNGYTITWVRNNQGSKDRDAFLGPVLTVNSGVTLIVADSSSGGAGGLSVSATARCTAVETGARRIRARAYLIENYGNLRLNGGTLNGYVGSSSASTNYATDGTSEGYVVRNLSGSTWTQNGGNVVMTGTATGETGATSQVDIFTNISGVILESGSTGTMNAGTINISHYAGEQDTGGRSAQAQNNASYGVVNNGTFSMYAGEIINNAQYNNKSTSSLTLPARGIAGNNTPTITGGNINSSVTSNRDGATNMAINANQYIDANNNTITNVETKNGGSGIVSGGAPYQDSTVVRLVYEYPNGTTHVPNANYGTVAFSYPGTQPTGVVSNANGYISYCRPNTQVIVSGATYYNRNFYDLSKIEYQTRNNVTGVWGSRTTLVAGVGFTIPNLTNNYTVYATYTAVSPTTPILTIDALSPTYTGSPIGYGNLFTITVNDASGTNDITSWYDVTGNGNSGLYASYEFSSNGGSTWTSSWPVNAGTYSLRVTLSSDLVLNQTAKNLNGVVQTTTVTIGKGTPTPGLPTVNLSYGQTLGGANIINGGGTAGTWTFDTPSITPTLADSGVTNYPATFTPSNSNYNTISQNLKVNVSKATVVVTANDRSQVYGTAPGTYTLNYAGFVMGDTLASVLPTGSVMPTVSCSYAQYSNAGTYPITVSVDGVVADNYNFVAGPNGTLTVNKAPLTVAATAVNRAYIAGNNNVTVNLGSLNGILNNDAVTLASTSVTGTVATPDVGTNKEVTFALPELSGAKALNYTVTCSNLPISVTITKAVPAYTIPDLDSQEYDPDVTLANYSSLLPTGWVWNELTTVPDVQTPVYEATYTPADTNNYQIVVIDVPLEITKAPVLITADNKSTTYGNVEPEFTYAFSGFKGADDENNVPRTGNIVASCDYNTLVPANRNADDYAIVLSGNPESNNYAYTLVDGTLTVNKADLRVKADNKSVVYGSPSPEFTNTYTEDDLVYDEDTIANSVDASGMDFDCSYAVGSNVGTYAIEPNGLVSTNYNFIYTNGVLTVTKATLNVAATNITLPYGSPIPTYTATYTGWVAGDNASNNDLTGSPNFTSPYTSTSPVQVDGYMITVSAGTLSSNNYTFVFTRGYVTVEKATPTVSVWPTATITYLDNLSSPTWDGSEVTSVPGSFVFDSVTTVPDYATGVSYDATFIPTDSNNYNTVQGSVLVIVNKRAISGSLSISGTAMEGETLTADISNILPSQAAAYLDFEWIIDGNVVSTGTTSGELLETHVGYTAQLIVTAAEPFEGTLTVTSPVISVLLIVPTADDLSYAIPSNFDYDSLSHPIDVTEINPVGSFTVLYNGSTTPPRNAGNYNVTVNFDGNEAYAAVSGVELGSFAINKVNLTATYTALDKTYDRTNTASYTNLSVTPIGSDVVTINTAGITCTFDNANVGTDKPVTLTGALLAGADAVNYNLVIQQTTADINRKSLLIYGEAINRDYDTTVAVEFEFTSGLIGILGPDEVDVAQPYATAFTFDPDAGEDKPLVDPEMWTFPALIGAQADNYYLTVASESDFDVTIFKATPSYTVPVLSAIEYDPNATLASIDLPTGWSWVGAGTVPSAAMTTYGAIFTPEDTQNYEIAEVEIPLTTTKAIVTVTAVDRPNVMYGDAIPQYSVTFSGFKGNDNSTNVPRSGNISYVCAYVRYADVGNYTITPTGNWQSTNYAYAYAPGTMTVSPKNIAASATAEGRAYIPGDSNVLVNIDNPTGILNNDDVSLSYSSTVGTMYMDGVETADSGINTVIFTAPTLTGPKAMNYNLIMVTSIPVTIEKATPTGVVFPSNAQVEYSFSLDNATFSNDSVIPAAIPGNFEFADVTIVPPSLGAYSYAVIFTPNENNNYNPITQYITVNVTVCVLDLQISITGNPMEESVLYATIIGLPTPAATYVDYYWYRGDPSGPIGTFFLVGQNPTYTVQAEDIGQQIYLVVVVGEGVDDPYTAPTSISFTDLVEELQLTFWEKISRWFMSIIEAIQALFDVSGRSSGGGGSIPGVLG